MPRLRKITRTFLLLTLLSLFAGTGQALASHSQTDFFEASTDLLNPSTRAHAIQQMQHLGVHALRVELGWYEVAPDPASATRPSFDATNPASYNWGQYDAVLAEAKRLGWPVLLTVTSPVPSWATSNHRAPYITRPDDQDFQEFMTAVGRHYGSEVSLFAIWNEPNHPAFLQPQFNSRGLPESPRIYRGLYQAGYTGLVASGMAKPRVLFGETAPVGSDRVNVHREGVLHDVAPLAFMREALCLNTHYRKSGSCGPLQMTGYAHHAYTLPAGPYYQFPEKDSVSIGSLSRLARALDLAAAAHAIPARTPIYLTEFGVQSTPNKQLGVPVGEQAEFDAIAEHIAWSNSRVSAFSQYLLKDDPLGGKSGSSVHGGTVGFQTGLEYVTGKPKPLYYSWPIPLMVRRSGRGVSLWGLARPAIGPTKVTVEARLKGSRHYRTLAKVTTNSLGYWTLHSSVHAQYWRVVWVNPEGVKYEGPPIKGH
jgi:Cellulase (glycosyl hydrolase family 5)